MAAETVTPKRRSYHVRWRTIGHVILTATTLFLAVWFCVVGTVLLNLNEPTSNEIPPRVRTPTGVHLLPLIKQVPPSPTTITPPPRPSR